LLISSVVAASVKQHDGLLAMQGIKKSLKYTYFRKGLFSHTLITISTCRNVDLFHVIINSLYLGKEFILFF